MDRVVPETLEAAQELIRALHRKVDQLEEENDLLALANNKLRQELEELKARSGLETVKVQIAGLENILPEDEGLLVEGDRQYVNACAARLPDASARTNVICIRFVRCTLTHRLFDFTHPDRLGTAAV